MTNLHHIGTLCGFCCDRDAAGDHPPLIGWVDRKDDFIMVPPRMDRADLDVFTDYDCRCPGAELRQGHDGHEAEYHRASGYHRDRPFNALPRIWRSKLTTLPDNPEPGV